MTNLDPVFCKMSVSIWIWGKPFFGALIFTFLATVVNNLMVCDDSKTCFDFSLVNL